MSLHYAYLHPGYQYNYATPYLPSFTTVFYSPINEAFLLTEQARQLDGFIQQLHQGRSALLSRVNTIQSPMNAIPPEILSRILEYACPPVEFYSQSASGLLDMLPPVLHLAAVCSRWRQVVISTPKLWTTLSIDIIHSHVRSDMAILKIFIENSKQHPISLRLNFRFYDDWAFGNDGIYWDYARPLSDNTVRKITTLPLQYVLDNLHGHAHKIKVLQIDSMPTSWIGALNLLSFKALKDLRLYWDEHPSIRIPSQAILLPDGVQSLTFRRFFLTLTPSWRPPVHLTVLQLERMCMDVCVKILPHCPHLLKLSSIHPKASRGITHIPAFTETVTMSQLEDLEWQWTEAQWNEDFLRHFEFPALRKLRWRGLCDDPGNPVIANFFHKLPTSSTMLDLVLTNESRAVAKRKLPQILDYFPHVVELLVEIIPSTYSIRTGQTSALARGILEVLRMEKGLSRWDSLLCLKTLCLKMEWHNGAEKDDRSSLPYKCLLPTLRARTNLGLKNFRLIWNAGLLIELDHKDEIVVGSLIDKGLNIEIFVRGERVYAIEPGFF